MAQQDKSDLHGAVHDAFKQYDKQGITDSPFSNLMLYQLALNRSTSTPHQATNYILEQVLDHLRQSNPEGAKLLQMRYLDKQSVPQAANTLNLSVSTIHAKQRDAIEDLALLLHEQEKNALSDQRHRLEGRLDALSNISVVGVGDQVEQLFNFVQPANSPWIISIEGLGGIGKTTLADALLRRVIETNLYYEIGWVSAKERRLNLGGAISQIRQPSMSTERVMDELGRQLFPQLYISLSHDAQRMNDKLRRRLKEVAHLIVVDNLETVEDVETLVPTLQTFADPTKFVLTSREQTYGHPNVSQVKVSELSQVDALSLMRSEAALRNLPELAQSPDTVLLPVYELVGGHPLALRLVVGQTHLYSLTTILTDLETARGESIQNLYSFIYQKSWEGLDETRRQVLLATAALSEQGDDIEQLAGLTGYDIETTRNALNRLVTQSLVDADGDYLHRRYKIHSLTRTFLRKEIAKWDATA